MRSKVPRYSLRSLFQGILSVCIQVIGRLIQKQDVGITVDELAQADLRLLASAQYPHLALDVFGSQAAFGKGGADFILVKGRKFLPDFFNTGRLFYNPLPARNSRAIDFLPVRRCRKEEAPGPGCF